MVADEFRRGYNTQRRRLRRILINIGTARFEFEDLNEATTAHPASFAEQRDPEI